MRNFIRIAVLVCIGAALLSADTIKLSGSKVASAVFNYTPGTNSFTVTLTNSTPVIDAADLLTDFIFQLSNGAGVPAPVVTVTSVEAGSGQLVTVDTNGAVQAYTGTQAAEWGFGMYSDSSQPQYNGSYLLCIICGAGVTAPAHIQPSEGILGVGTGSAADPYSTANSSIDGNKPHNPFFGNLVNPRQAGSSVTFQFQATGLTAHTAATNVNFSFGTTWGTEIPGGTTQGGDLPEPMTFVLTGTALLGVGIVKRRRASGRD